MEYLGFKTKSSGVYKITNTTTGKVYVGQTVNFYKRFHGHRSAYFRKDTDKVNCVLLDDYEKYGFENFTFEEIYYCIVKEDLPHMENHYMMEYDSFNSEYGYNLITSDGCGISVSEYTSSKISDRLKSEWSNGIRDQHSDKMKKSWVTRDRCKQSTLMSKTLTKYYYCIDNDLSNKLLYAQLVDLGLSNALNTFHRKKTDKVLCKGFVVERFKYED